MRRVLYLACPVAPTAEEREAALQYVAGDASRGDIDGMLAVLVRKNLNAAMDRLAWLHRSFPETTFIAPWIANIMSGENDAIPEQREDGLVDACAVIERCDGIVLWGPRLSTGMQRERDHGVKRGVLFVDRAASSLPAGHMVYAPRFDTYDMVGWGDVEAMQATLEREEYAAKSGFAAWHATISADRKAHAALLWDNAHGAGSA